MANAVQNNLNKNRKADDSSASKALPEFEKPPVTEVALSLQFEPLAKLKGPLIGLLWGKFKDRYPRVEEHSPIDKVIEHFGEPQSISKLQFQLLDSPPPARVWFISESGNELIQIQQDRFIYNWRKLRTEDQYTRYSQLRAALSRELEIFREFLREENVGELVFNQTEVTFVNIIISGEGWDRHGQIHNVLTVHSGSYSDSFFDEPETIQTVLRYIIPSESGGAPRGRLHFTIHPVIAAKDKKPALNLTIIARCIPNGTVEDAMRCLDLSHDWMVRGFASITTTKMHQIWGRKNEQ